MCGPSSFRGPSLNRLITQIGQSIYEWFFTKPAQDNMVALGKLSAAVLGTAPIANGLACTPTSPATLQVTIGAGELYALAPLEASVYGTLPADTTHLVVKQGISLDPVLVSCAPPPTGGQAINYLVQVQYQDLDVSLDPTTGNPTPVVLQFYNSSNPSQPWQGPNNSGQTSNTIRKGIVAVQTKAGIAAPTGSQVTPAPDGGWTGLWVVTVANGQTTITAGNITQYSGAPILSETLTQKISQATGDARYAALAGSTAQLFSVAPATQPQHAAQLGQIAAVQGVFKNLKVAALGVNNSSAVVTVDELVLENGSNLYASVRGVNVTINAAGAVGQPNSLSTGALAASTWYYVWVWYNGTTVCGTLDPSATAPTAPSGYTAAYRARVGAVRTDSSGNKYLLQTLQYGRKAQYVVNATAGSNVVNLPALASAVVGNPDAPTYSAIATGAFVPSTASEIDLVMKAGSASGHSICAPNSSYSNATSTIGTPPMVICISAYGPAPIVTRALITLESTNIYYASNDSSYGVLLCCGWVDNI